jgi:NitT/TauT family transport system substrate-binding protein
MIGAFDRTDAHVLMSREQINPADFKWEMLKGKKIMSKRIASIPSLTFEYALRKQGLNPKDLNLETVASSPARTGMWIAGQAGFDFGIFDEPHASRIIKEGKGYPVATLGDTVGEIDYTMFAATDSYIKKNPQVLQAFINAMYKSLKWMENAPAEELATMIKPYFPTLDVGLLESTIANYKKIRLWKTDLETTPAAVDRLQDVLVEGGTLKREDRVKYEAVYDPTFARMAKETIR